jgi:HD superfamily phosphodiesterase
VDKGYKHYAPYYVVMATLLSKLLQFVLLTTAKHQIDESHGISHSMNVLHYAMKIYTSELPKIPELKSQERTIFVSAIIHDMCDKKYMNEDEGIKEIEKFLCEKITPDEIETTKQIISTMSYSKVKKSGFPIIDGLEKNMAYHIVREADLLSAYDFDRSILYHIHQSKSDINEAYENASKVFNNRILRHEEDGLFITDFSRNEAINLKINAQNRMNAWRSILHKGS